MAPQQDVLERITVCIRVLLDPSSLGMVKDTFLTQCKESYAAFLKFKNDEVIRPQPALPHCPVYTLKPSSCTLASTP